MKKVTIILLVIAIILIAMIYGCYRAFQPDIGTCETAADFPIKGWLPDEARDISYFLPGAFWPNTLCEFTISEDGFRKWVEVRRRKNPKVGPIEEKHDFHMFRYDIDTKKIGYLKIDDGLSSHWSEGDSGLSFGYDRDKKRAYYYCHSR
ncbi:hypothetical protein M0R36_08985 [bacterium]|jgi:hypothetical protein|nr:hypothetical protein [bacterium]